METRSSMPVRVVDAPRFASVDDELRYLRERVRDSEERLGAEGKSDNARLAKKEIDTYAHAPTARVLHESFVIPEHDIMHEVLKLEPETHDKQIDRLLALVQERGIKNALSVAARMNNPHLEDDLHRALVRYVAEGLPSRSIPGGERMKNALHLALFEVSPQAHTASGEKTPLKDLLQSSEQLYAGLLSLIGKEGSFSLEIASTQGSEEAILYVAVPKERGDVAERLIASVFPGARVMEVRGDYNIFNAEGAHAAAVANFGSHSVFPIKTYDALQHDPMNVILAAFAKIAKHGEGAALQIVVGNEGERYNTYYKKILRALEKGESVKDALRVPETAFGAFVGDVADAFWGSKKKDEPAKPKAPDEGAVEVVRRKVSGRIVPANIRIVASAKSEERARELMQNLASPFGQFDDPRANKIVFSELTGSRLKKALHAFSFRLFEPSLSMPMNFAELTSVFHLTAEGISTSRELKKASGKQAPAPVRMPSDGIVLGSNVYGGTKSDVLFGAQDRLRHAYVIGQTGTGKTTLLKSMIIQDIKNGDGVAYIDPHGADIEEILASVPEHRRQDVIYFDPAYAARPMGLNLLEYDPSRPEMKTLIVDEIYGIFRKLFPDVPEAFGPMFEQYYRNATMLVLEDPSTGCTLLEIPRVFADREFRQLKLSHCQNPIVVQFWRDIAEKTGGEHALENMVPWITSKFDPFLANDIMRPIVAQERSAFNFRDIMDNKKIFLANLSKGRLGERNMALLGLVLVSKFAQAAFSRADTRNDAPPFYLYIDEFQNFTTPSAASILSEARKYKLSLTIAHQFLAQLTDELKNAVIGNVGTKIAFRLGAQDAEFLEKQFAPTFSAHDLENLENLKACVALLIDGSPSSPFSLELAKHPHVDYTQVDRVKEISYTAFGRPREEVESEIKERFSRT